MAKPPEPKKMPALFMGHGSPMNILDENPYTQAMKDIAAGLPQPAAILCVSAHWIRPTTEFTGGPAPKQIYDFYGFPEELYKVKYTPPGAPELAHELAIKLNGEVSNEWGLDHGAWSILHHMYPQQDIPVVQMSLNMQLTPIQILDIGAQLSELRERDVLLLASGNLVHNLRRISWNANATPPSWAIEFEELILDTLNMTAISKQEKVERIMSAERLHEAHPTLEHLFPLFYILGATDSTPKIEIQGLQNGSISMASLIFN